LKTFAFIFARGGSKGLPRKNIRKLAGKPLIVHSIDLAKEIPSINKIFVSTEDAEIASIAEQNQATVINRPSSLASDNSPEWLSWKHAINYTQDNFGSFQNFISLPSTSPLRNADDITRCLNTHKRGVDVVVTMTKSQRSPWFNMVQKDVPGSLKLILRDGRNNITNRQNAPESFDLTTVAYVTSPSFILNNNSIWDGQVMGVEIPPERAIDIDTLLDFEIAEFLYSRKR
jgi:CMP-N-acetylneuraminic acid synthetase